MVGPEGSGCDSNMDYIWGLKSLKVGIKWVFLSMLALATCSWVKFLGNSVGHIGNVVLGPVMRNISLFLDGCGTYQCIPNSPWSLTFGCQNGWHFMYLIKRKPQKLNRSYQTIGLETWLSS